MKLKEILIVGGIALILLAVIMVAGNKNKEKEGEAGGQTPVAQVQENKVEEFVEVKSDGTKVNTSNQLAKTKTVEGLEISNIQLTENGNLSKITANVKNPTSQTKGDFAVKITILDKNGKEMATIGGYIDKVNPGETVKLSASATVDFANAYDFKVTKK